MCGGKGTRLESAQEKPLYPIGGAAMVDRVLAALEASRIATVYAAVSPNAPETRAHLEALAADDSTDPDRPTVTLLETAGEGYVADLMTLLERPALEPPILTVAADLPLLEAPAIDRVLATHGGTDASLTVCVPVALKRRLGVSVDATLESSDHLAPTGVNVVGNSDSETNPSSMTHLSYDPRLAINVNRREDARIAADWTARSPSRSVDRSGTDGGEGR
ncbi:GTP--adenosylcobinamide-phosphate guanylyl transferase [Natronolimnohabitans innermongolicus]|uniref:GTP:adenosylcobinamide-phosphate guanylyl transferase-like protein n=1 Tax=Natronolimnohabitans innermongolicus JCM 12255 TaxID=1227499 RepID=L9WT09_9EURY|nr:GTP--adenosylcobinamide-phosphate guanylyl transferase [Natronolimnohabitans innermongolicus]ELY52585.1 GTP:adenosylcobinamide-phosphate guanylyl transferase-like protein [Natronolimnohabitans innermongolicus JCM 12255]